MSGIQGSLQPGDSKSTADKLSEDAKSVGQNIQGTASHYADKADNKTGASAIGQNIQDTASHYAGKADAQTSGNVSAAKSQGAGLLNQAGDTAAAVGKNVQDTASHYAAKAQDATTTSTTGEGKTYLEQAQDLASNALNTASKAAADAANYISGEKK